MSAKFEVRTAESEADFADLAALCWAYRDFLLSMPQPDRQAVTNAYPPEKYKVLMADLPRLHTPPIGKALLVKIGAKSVGCGMFYTFAPGIAEVKRVFLSDEARGLGAGRAIMEALIDDCRGFGFDRIYLDTGRLLQSAITLYLALGFKPRGPYQDVPAKVEPLLRFFELELSP